MLPSVEAVPLAGSLAEVIVRASPSGSESLARTLMTLSVESCSTVALSSRASGGPLTVMVTVAVA